MENMAPSSLDCLLLDCMPPMKAVCCPPLHLSNDGNLANLCLVVCWLT